AVRVAAGDGRRTAAVLVDDTAADDRVADGDRLAAVEVDDCVVGERAGRGNRTAERGRADLQNAAVDLRRACVRVVGAGQDQRAGGRAGVGGTGVRVAGERERGIHGQDTRGRGVGAKREGAITTTKAGEVCRTGNRAQRQRIAGEGAGVERGGPEGRAERVARRDADVDDAGLNGRGAGVVVGQRQHAGVAAVRAAGRPADVDVRGAQPAGFTPNDH